jgi:hypothetical protein
MNPNNPFQCFAASPVLERPIYEEGIDIALIQEPYAQFNATNKTFSSPTSYNMPPQPK